MNSLKTILNLVTLALHFSCFLLVGVVFFLASQSAEWSYQFRLLESKQILAVLFAGMSVMQIGIATIFPRIAKKPDQTQPGPIFLNFRELTQQEYTFTIVRLALCESITIFGFVLSFLFKDALWVLPFFAVSQIAMIAFGPFNPKGNEKKAYYE